MAKDYHLHINGEQVKVDKAVYEAYMRSTWTEQKRRQTLAKREQSLDVLVAYNLDPADPRSLLEEIVEDGMMLDLLVDALSKLTKEERALIQAIFFDEKAERTVAEELSVSQKTVNQRKRLLLAKLRKKICGNL